MAKTKPPPTPPPTPTGEYTVVARRYRPQQFAELIGQEHVAQALVNALQSGRVAHAYLFTGARGVGKTSAARILAKALNCEKGPTPTPCDACDSCKGVASGDDADVVEIDGASNRGIDDARELRQGVGFRPTRGRYKIYIIDEVHMLTKEAFNALLKTLEEPPPHVKFIFATTEVQKIPITILSRCQRFDFAHVGPTKIFEQLQSIVQREGHQADDAALRLIARRAAGSMRDSQSLLDQLLASGQGKLTAEHVQAVLGTAGDARVAELVTAILSHDSKLALETISGWVDQGFQVGELIDGLVEYWRTLMLLSCAPDLKELPLQEPPRDLLLQQARSLSLDTILAGLDVWTSTKARMRGSSHGPVLLEMAVVRLSRLDELLSVGQLASVIRQGGPVPTRAPTAAAQVESRGNGSHPPTPRLTDATDPSKKNGLPDRNGGLNGAAEHGLAALPITAASLPDLWGRLIRYLGDKAPALAHQLRLADLLAIFGPNSLAIRFHSGYKDAYDACASPLNVARIQDALAALTRQSVLVKPELVSGPAPAGPAAQRETPVGPSVAERKKALMNLPLFKKAGEVFGAQIWTVDDDFSPSAVPVRPVRPAEPDDDEPATPAVVPDPDEA